jgi:tetratricopeptide (TPR) repeat protein
MINWENTLSTYEAKSVGAAFTAQLDELAQQFPDVINLLKILSFFDPESIPLNMISQGAEALSHSLFPSLVTLSDTPSPGKVLSLLRQTKRECLESVAPQLNTLLPLMLSPIQLQDAITQLQNRSLVRHLRNVDSSILRIHDLTKIMVQASLTNSGTDREWFKIAVELACGAFQLVEDPASYKCWPQSAMFAPHLHLLTLRDEIYGSRNIQITKANVKIATYLWSSGRYAEAERLLGAMLEASSRQLGLEHRDTVGIMHDSANVYYFQGRYNEAETQYKRVLALSEKLLGVEHPDTLATMHNLAIVYDSQGRRNEAETQYKHVLALREKVLGVEHPHTLGTMLGLANVYDSQGRHDEAEMQYKHVLALREKLLGVEHTDTLRVMHNLANVYDSQGRHDDAEAQCKRVLVLREKVLGVEHPDTLRTMHGLANVYHSQGRHNEAETEYKHVLALSEKLLGLEHPHTLLIMRDLANVYYSQGRYNEAETHYKHVVTLKEKVLGVEHLDTMHGLADAYVPLDCHSEAEVLRSHLFDRMTH